MGPGARWSRTKEAVAGDRRYRALPREAREALFRAYVAEAEARVAPLGASCMFRVFLTAAIVMSPACFTVW